MKHLKTQKQLNEASENLNISDVISRLSDRVDEIANKTDADIEDLSIMDFHKGIDTAKFTTI